MSSDDNVLLRFSIGVALEEKSKIEKVTKKRIIFFPCRGSESNDKKSMTASIFSSSKKPAV